MDIGIKSGDVKTKAESFRGTGKDKYSDMRTYLNGVIFNELPELWQGSGSEAYVRRYQELKPSFDAIERLIDDIANGLIANANFYEEADREAARANNAKA